MPASQSQLSPRGAVVVGLLAMAAGVAPVLGALGVLPLSPTPGTPVWVGVCAGMLFVFGGLAVINGFAFGGGGAIQALRGIAICIMMAAVAGWVAFGPGERHFSTSISLPFLARGGSGGESMGRAMFGFGAIAAAALAVAFATRAIRRTKS